MSGKLDDALNDCLERLAQGEDIYQCIERYPEYKDELLPLLSLARRAMRTASSSKYGTHAKARGLMRIQKALVASRQRRRRRFQYFLSFPLTPLTRPVMVGFAVVFITLIAAGGTTAVSSNSVPGEPLYPIKSLRESVALNMVPHSDIEKAKMHAEFAGKRGEEISILIEQGKVSDAEELMRRLQYHLNQSANHVGIIVVSDSLEIPANHAHVDHPQNTLVIKEVLERDGKMIRSRIVKLMGDTPPEQRRHIRRLMHRANLNYGMLVQALEAENDGMAQMPVVRIRHSALLPRQ